MNASPIDSGVLTIWHCMIHARLASLQPCQSDMRGLSCIRSLALARNTCLMTAEIVCHPIPIPHHTCMPWEPFHTKEAPAVSVST